MPQVVLLLLIAAAGALGDQLCAEEKCRELPLKPNPDCSGGPLRSTCRDARRRETLAYPEGAVTLRPDTPVCPHRSQQNCTTYNCSSCQYQNDTQIISGLQLHAELEHFDDSYFGIVLKWNRPSTAAATNTSEDVNITGYFLTITEDPLSTCDGVQDLVGCRCSHLDSDTTMFSYTHAYRKSLIGDAEAPDVLYVKLIPEPWCDGPNLTIRIPETCHNVLPGVCTTCGRQKPLLILPPTNVQVVASLNEDEQTMQATISWESGHYYHRPYLNSSFYLAIRVHPDGREATPRLEVFGRTNVTLQYLNPHLNYSVQIRAYDCGCADNRRGWSTPMYINLYNYTVSNQVE